MTLAPAGTRARRSLTAINGGTVAPGLPGPSTAIIGVVMGVITAVANPFFIVSAIGLLLGAAALAGVLLELQRLLA